MSLKYFRILAYLECVSLLILLLVAMPLKYFMGIPEAVKFIGMIHGILFLMYVYTSLSAMRELRWSGWNVFQAWIIAVIPLGPVLFEKKLFSAAE